MVRSNTLGRWLRALLLATLVGGCSTGSNSTVGGTGGEATAGGSGTQGSGAGGRGGGTPGTGGVPGTGGATANGGTVGTGGAPATGGAPGTGGAPATGGARGTGGVLGTGGMSTGAAGAPATGFGGAGGAKSLGGASGTTVGDGDFMVGPTYTPSPDLKLKAGAPAGFSVSFSLSSAMSQIFTGSDFTPPLTFTRTIKVWVPQQYVDGTASPFMVSSDGFYAGLQTVVQNLADDPSPAHRVPPLVIIGIQNGPDVHPNSERSLEYDTVSDRYWRFVTQEVIPAALSNKQLLAKYPNFKLTSDPNGRGGYGCSSGGPAVMGLAWFGDFNRVFSFSGSFVALQKTADHPFGAWEYTGMITNTPARQSLRVFQEVCENDHGAGTPDSTHTNWVTSNTNMAHALAANGNHQRFILALGAGHCDSNARNEVMPDGLIWLWQDYQQPN